MKNTNKENKGLWLFCGMLCHLLPLAMLHATWTLFPDAWRGRIVIKGHQSHFWDLGGPTVPEVREHDAQLLGLIALASLVASLLVMLVSWNRRREFGLGFAIPAIWAVIEVMK